MTNDDPLLSVENLSVSFMVRAGEARVLREVSLAIREGESLGLVGESGCGKSTFALAIMRYLGDTGRITGGRIMFKGTDIVTASERQLRDIRSNGISVVYQDPLSCLNPLMPIGRQLMEVPMLHGVGQDEAHQRALDILREVQLPDPGNMMERYPHQLSGGQQQRIVIAMAMIAQPSLLILDEPTTGLDVTVEAAVLELLRELRRVRRTAMLYISHNFGTIVRLCDRVGVLYAGEIVETGDVGTVFRNPDHPYTRGLLNCLPGANTGGRRSPLFQIRGQIPSPFETRTGCGFADRCHAAQPARCQVAPIPLTTVNGSPDHMIRCVRSGDLPPLPGRAPALVGEADHAGSEGASVRISGLRKFYERGWAFGVGRRPPLRALDGISISATRNRTLGLVGESGCGKSTLSRILSGLTVATEGEAWVDDFDVSLAAVERRPKHIKRAIQMVFQNPDSTLNPSHTVGFSVRRTLQRLRGMSSREARREADALLALVKLPAGIARRKPQQLSGGQKQRVAIARALAAQPRLIIADEPVSALDVSVQAAILNLMNELQESKGTTYVFVSHDLAVVRHVADDVAIIYLGRVMESGRADDVFTAPYHPYTEALISAVPRLTPDLDHKPIVLEGTLPNPADPIHGCPFSSRCPRRIGEVCDTVEPPEQALGNDHRLACHIPAAELARLQVDLPGL